MRRNKRLLYLSRKLQEKILKTVNFSKEKKIAVYSSADLRKYVCQQTLLFLGKANYGIPRYYYYYGI